MPEKPVTIEALLAERDWLHDLARRLVVDAGTADDLVQETWLTALRRPPRHDRGLRGWLATVLRNRAHDARLRDRREIRRAERAPRAEPPDDPAELVARAELEQRVARLTLAMSEPYRGTLLMRYHRGLSPKEIAERLGEPAGTVRSRLKRGLDMLRDRLDRDHDGRRRAWMVALLPLAHRAPKIGGPLMLTATMKAAVLCALLAVAGSAVILAAPGGDPDPEILRADAATEPLVDGDALEPVAEEGAAPAAPDAPGEGDDGGKPGKKKPSLLDRKIDVKFENLPFLHALYYIRDTTGLHVEFETGVAADLANTTVTLKVAGLSIRNLLELLMAYGGDLSWEERGEGTVVIRKKPGKPPAPAPERPWFGSRIGMFSATPWPVKSPQPPDLTLPEADMARPYPVGEDPIEILVAADGTWFLGETPIASEFALWLALLERPDAPVLVRADLRAPISVVKAVRVLGPGRTISLAIDGAGTLPVPPVDRRAADPPETIRLMALAWKPPSDSEEVRGFLWRVWRANTGKTLVLSVLLPEAATVGQAAVFLNEAERFGCHLTLGVLRGSFGRDTAIRLTPPRGTVLADGPVPPESPGVILGSRGARPTEVWPVRWLRGRPGRRNLRAGGGGGTQGAVDLGHSWLVSQQREDGSWGGDPEETSLALLAFLAGGETDRSGRSRECVAKALAWVEDLEAPCGRGAVALAEAWALTLDPRWRKAAEIAVARGASTVERRLVRFCGVRVEVPAGAIRGADPLACFHRILAGQTVFGSESLATAITALAEPTRDDPDGLRRADDEFLHDAALAVFQAGGTAWAHFNRALKKAVVDTQVREGAEAGSWNPPRGGSRVRTTALRVATLTVYFRYPRLFRK